MKPHRYVKEGLGGFIRAHMLTGKATYEVCAQEVETAIADVESGQYSGIDALVYLRSMFQDASDATGRWAEFEEPENE